jgi:hypothetical protein
MLDGVCSKRGQLTLFVIVGVIIVGGIVGYFALRDSSVSDTVYDKEITALRDNIEDCYVLLGESSINYVAYRGGVYTDRDVMFDDGNGLVAYYYDHGDVDFPSLREVEIELGNAVSDAVPFCVEVAAANGNYDVEYGEAETKVVVGRDFIDFTTELDVTVRYDNKTVILSLSDFEYSVASVLMQMHEFSEAYVRSITRSPEEWLAFSEMDDFADSLGLFVQILGYGDADNSQLVTVYADDLEKAPIAYRFTMAYDYIDLGLPVKLDVEEDDGN